MLNTINFKKSMHYNPFSYIAGASSSDVHTARILLDLTYNEVRRLIQTGEIEAKKYGLRYLIPRDDIKWFLFQQKLDREN